MKRETILTILLAIAVLLLLKEYNRNGKDITFKTKEVKGGFEMVKPKQKEIKQNIINNVPNKDNSRVQRNFAHEKNDSINTKLLAENEALIKAFATYTDSVKQAKYNEAISLKDFSQTFNDTSLTVNVFGKVRGEVIGVGMNYTIKPQTINATLKQYTVFLGLNTVSNPSFSNTAVLPTISYLNAKGVLFTAGKDIICNDCYMAGLQTRIFSINRVKR